MTKAAKTVEIDLHRRRGILPRHPRAPSLPKSAGVAALAGFVLWLLLADGRRGRRLGPVTGAVKSAGGRSPMTFPTTAGVAALGGFIFWRLVADGQQGRRRGPAKTGPGREALRPPPPSSAIVDVARETGGHPAMTQQREIVEVVDSSEPTEAVQPTEAVEVVEVLESTASTEGDEETAIAERTEGAEGDATTEGAEVIDTSEEDLPRHRRNLPLLRSSLSLSTSAGVAALGGFIFWLLVAHIAPSGTVGVAAALFSSIQFVNYATGLGLPVAVARYGGGRELNPTVLFNWSVVFTVVSSFIGAIIYFAIVPHELHLLTKFTIVGSVLIFGLIVAGISIGTVLDVRLIAQQRRGWVVARAMFIFLVRLPFLFVHGIGHSTLAIFFVAAGAPAIAGIGGWLIADVFDGRISFPLHPLPGDTGAAFTYAMVNGAAQLAMQAPFYALPVVVLVIVPARENASFYVAWTIATVVFLIIQSIGQALLVEGNRSGALASQTRTALQFGVALALVLAVACTIGWKVLPLLYGSSYDAGARILPLLGVAGIPWAVYSVVLSATRVHHDQHRRNLWLSGLFAASVLGPAAILVDKYGINGGAEAWLIGNVVSAAAALIILRSVTNSPTPVDETELVSAPPPII